MILHVLNYCGVEVDYLVGAQLEGFDSMVRLSKTAEFILIEGDEYLSSPIDLRPKIHWYQPTVALISGIAWDHINVFPTKEIYVEQFKIFIDSITKGGILVYNEEDDQLKNLAETTENTIRKLPYRTPEFEIHNGKTYLLTDEGELPLSVFGKHNLNNLEGAKWVCQNMGIDSSDFYEAILSFKGASKRMEKLWDSNETIVIKDFAHAPSKVKATVEAVVSQYPDKKTLACLELHTFSSLNPEFLKEYKNSLSKPDIAVVFYDQEALKAKGKADIAPETIRTLFNREDLIVFTNSTDFRDFLNNSSIKQTALLLMSSGNYGGLNFSEFIDKIKNIS